MLFKNEINLNKLNLQRIAKKAIWWSETEVESQFSAKYEFLINAYILDFNKKKCWFFEVLAIEVYGTTVNVWLLIVS